MKKREISLLLALMLALMTAVIGCGGKTQEDVAGTVTSRVEETTDAEDTDAAESEETDIRLQKQRLIKSTRICWKNMLTNNMLICIMI